VQFEWYNNIKKKGRKEREKARKLFQLVCKKYDTVSGSSKLQVCYMSQYGEYFDKNSIYRERCSIIFGGYFS
jgi:hypothetical protein